MDRYRALRTPRPLGRLWILLAASVVTLAACLQEPPPDLTPRDSGSRTDASTSDDDDAGQSAQVGVDAGRDR